MLSASFRPRTRAETSQRDVPTVHWTRAKTSQRDVPTVRLSGAHQMGAIDLLLNVAGLLLWISWRSQRFDPLVRSTPVTLVGTLKRAETKRLKGVNLALVLVSLVVLRAVLYWLLGAPANWTPKINLELVVLAFRGDLFGPALLYSGLSFL